MFSKGGGPPVTTGSPDPPGVNLLNTPQTSGSVFQRTAPGHPNVQNASPFGVGSGHMQLFGASSQQNLFAPPAASSFPTASTAFGHHPPSEKRSPFERLGTANTSPQLITNAVQLPGSELQPTKHNVFGVPSGFSLKQELLTPQTATSATITNTLFDKNLAHTSPFGTSQAAPRCEGPLFGSSSSPLKMFGTHAGKQDQGKPSLFGNAMAFQQSSFASPAASSSDSGANTYSFGVDQGKKQDFSSNQSEKSQSFSEKPAQLLGTKPAESNSPAKPEANFSPFSNSGTSKLSFFGGPPSNQDGTQGFTRQSSSLHPQKRIFGNLKSQPSASIFGSRAHYTEGSSAAHLHKPLAEMPDPPLHPPSTNKQRAKPQSTETPHPAEKMERREAPTLPSELKKESHSSRNLLTRALAGLEGDRGKGAKLMATPKEISTLVTLMCNNVPAELNNRETLLEHFSQFGPIARITCLPHKECATVKFHDHQTAALARKHGTRLSSSCPPLEIFWCSSSRRLSTEGGNRSLSGSAEQEKEGIAEPRVLQRPDEIPAKRPPLVKKTSETGRGSSLLSKLTKPKVASAKALLQRKTASNREAIDTATCTIQVQDEAQLMAELRRTAHTVGERFRTLDARDKIIRLHLQKQSDIVTARATRGCCPDMCPEKERYSRTDKKCLSPFEVLPGSDGVMDPRRMIKEYSRSSADQEEPLPHELRPPAVLSLTMDYLMTNIMDIPENVPVGEWYDFIWNRTRAIRKDITQQHLCDLTSVSLVEKCTRFHIHCAAVLIEEDMTTFDSKINDENLGKCLQTLKHLYYDLSLRDVRCPNEAEFRAYDVLLHLNEGDIVWQVQQLPEDIRRSPEVCLSVAASGALNCHNYVRFFRIAAEAPYLSSCLLHRYFAQVRTQALQTILKACRQTSHKEEIPLSTLVDQLKFDDASEAKDFAMCLGQAADEKFLYVDRSSQAQLERAPIREGGGGNVIFSARRGWEQKGRSKLLVESKRTCSVGEVVNGGPLPLDPLISYSPHDSFMADGTLRPAAYDAGDQLQKCWGGICVEELVENVKEVAAPQVQLPPVAPPAPLYSNEVIKDVARDMINETITDCARSLGREEIFTELSNLVAKTVVDEVTHESTKEVCQEVYLRAEEQRLQEILIAKQLAREQALQAEQRCRALLVEEITAEIVQEDVNAMCRLCHQEAMQDVWDKQSEDIMSNLVSSVVESEVQTAATTAFEEERNLYDAKLSKAITRSRLRLMKRSFKRWLEYKAEQKTMRVARETFPAIPNLYFDLNAPELGLSRKRQRVMPIEHDCVKKYLDVAVTLKILHEELEWAPVDVLGILRKASGNFQFPFKLLVSLPNSRQKELDELSAKILMKLGFSEQQVSLSSGKVGTRIHNEEDDMPFCITAVRCSPLGISCDHLARPHAFLGTSAVLFIMSSQLENGVAQRLKELVTSISKLDPIPPVCVLDASQEGSSSVLDTVDFDLQEQLQRVTEKSLVLGPRDIKERGFARMMEEALEWCVASRRNVPGFHQDYVKDFVEKAIVELAFDVIYGDITVMQDNPEFPHLLLKLYNSAVEHLANVLASESIARLSVALPELNPSRSHVQWNEPSYLLLLHKIVLSLRLPPIYGDVDEVDTVWEYVKRLCKTTGCQSNSGVFTARVQEALMSHGSPRQTRIPWASIIHDCYCHVLQSTNFFDPATGKEYIAHYIEDELYSFNVPQFWDDALHWASPTKRMKTTPASPICDTQGPMEETSCEEHTMSVTFDQLDDLLQKQKAESKLFTSQLAKLVSEDPVEESMVPTGMDLDICNVRTEDTKNFLPLADAVESFNLRVESSRMTNLKMNKMIELVLSSGGHRE